MNLCTHYGFGDYVMCYSLVRELAKRYDNINLFAIPHSTHLDINNIRRLYRSIGNVNIITDNPNDYHDVVYLGYDKFFEAVRRNPSIQIQKFIYSEVGVPLELMWNNFYFKRDAEAECEAFEMLALNEDYIFLHDDPKRGFTIDKKYLKDMRIVRLSDIPDVSILDCLYIVEKAVEVHTYNTGLTQFIDLMGIKHDSLNYHHYVRPAAFERPILKLNWKIYE